MPCRTVESMTSRPNSLDPFCINFANERPQNFVQKRIFEAHVAEYQNEGISHPVSTIPHLDNAQCIHRSRSALLIFLASPPLLSTTSTAWSRSLPKAARSVTSMPLTPTLPPCPAELDKRTRLSRPSLRQGYHSLAFVCTLSCPSFKPLVCVYFCAFLFTLICSYLYTEPIGFFSSVRIYLAPGPSALVCARPYSFVLAGTRLRSYVLASTHFQWTAPAVVRRLGAICQSITKPSALLNAYDIYPHTTSYDHAVQWYDWQRQPIRDS